MFVGLLVVIVGDGDAAIMCATISAGGDDLRVLELRSHMESGQKFIVKALAHLCTGCVILAAPWIQRPAASFSIYTHKRIHEFIRCLLGLLYL